MPSSFPDPKEMGRWMALSQIGMEMVAPIVLGAVIDYYLNCSPWGAAIGVIVGFFGGIAHLLMMVNQNQDSDSTGPRKK
jgi:F0F1-type ATP synthase assembly protein I